MTRGKVASGKRGSLLLMHRNLGSKCQIFTASFYARSSGAGACQQRGNLLTLPVVGFEGGKDGRKETDREARLDAVRYRPGSAVRPRLLTTSNRIRMITRSARPVCQSTTSTGTSAAR